MEENIREISERLDQMEKVLSELSRRVDAIEGSKVANSAPTVTKKQKGKVFPRVIAAILVLCLIAGSAYYALSNRKPSYEKAEIGDIITFGKYDQNNSEADGLEPIEWIVLDKQDGKLLLLSKYNLFAEQYAMNNGADSWEYSLIRKKLNGDFIYSAFSSQEQNQIVSRDYLDSKGLFNDKVFLLNEEEVKYYFPTEKSRIALPTETCISKSGEKDSPNSWWTRTSVENKDPYFYLEYVFVNMDGEIQDTRTSNSLGVRPAIWLDTTK